MRIRKLDKDGDFVFGGNRKAYFENSPDGVAQNIRTRLELWKGAWFLDTSEGLDWATRVLTKSNRKIYDQEIRSRILGTKGVRAITAYESVFDADKRKVIITAEVLTDYGTTKLTEVI